MNTKIINVLRHGPASAKTVGIGIGRSYQEATNRMTAMVRTGEVVICDIGRKGGNRTPKMYALANVHQNQSRTSFLSAEARQWMGWAA